MEHLQNQNQQQQLLQSYWIDGALQVTSIIFLMVWLFLWTMHIVAIFHALRRLHRRSPARSSKSSFLTNGAKTLPSVSILKPLMGVDRNLYSNLESFFELDYDGSYELLFCVEDKSDAAIDVVNRLMAIKPHVDARLFVGGATSPPPIGVNPKINNMQQGYYAARYDLVMIADSGITMRSDALTDMVQCLTNDEHHNDHHLNKQDSHHHHHHHHNRDHERAVAAKSGGVINGNNNDVSGGAVEKIGKRSHPNIGLVHQLPFTVNHDHSFAGVLEQVYFGTAHARPYLFADCCRVNCSNGMSTLMRKSVLDRRGGLAAFGCYLAEDFFIAKAFTEWNTDGAPYALRVARLPALQNSNITEIGIAYFRRRILRWTQLRQAMLPHMLVLEPFSQCAVIGAVAAWSFTFRYPAIDAKIAFAVHVAVWFCLDLALFLAIRRSVSVGLALRYVPAWLLSELCVTEAYLRAIVQRTIVWRGKRFRLRWGGVAQQLPD